MRWHVLQLCLRCFVWIVIFCGVSYTDVDMKDCELSCVDGLFAAVHARDALLTAFFLLCFVHGCEHEAL